MRRKGIIDFVVDQTMKTVRRPWRVFTVSYNIGLSLMHRAPMLKPASAMTEDIVLAMQNIKVSEKVDADVGRIFTLVMGDLAKRPYPSGYQISKRWRTHLRNALANAGKQPSAAVLTHISLSTFDVELKGLNEFEREHLLERRRDFNRKHNEFASLCESPVCPENTTVAVDGGTHSNKLDQAFSYYDDIYSAIPKTERLRTIAEIGSGNGQFARIMHQLDPGRRYILIDLPESLIFAYAFLAVNFPDAKKLFIASPADARNASSDEFDFVFCPVQFLEHLSCGPIDLVLNTYSFCEMPQSSADYLVDCIHKVLRPHYLYSLNMMFSDKDINFDTGGWDGDANEVALDLAPEWRILKFYLAPEIVMGKYRMVGGIVLEHIPGDSMQAAVSAALLQADQLEFGDAARVANLYFAAKWSLDEKLIARFLFELEQYCIGRKFPTDSGYEFERIGEVRQLRRLALISIQQH